MAILVRVSTNRQETDRQISDLTNYAAQKGYNVIEVCREIVSGRADENEDIRLVEYAKSDLLQALTAGQIQDAKTLIALQWLQLQGKL